MVQWAVQWVMYSLHAVHLVCWYSFLGVSPWQWALPSLSQPSRKKNMIGASLQDPQQMSDSKCSKSHYLLKSTCVKMNEIPVVASPDWGCSPLPGLPVCISLCRFLRPESPHCPREQPWGPRFPFPLAPLRPGRGGKRANTEKCWWS